MLAVGAIFAFAVLDACFIHTVYRLLRIGLLLAHLGHPMKNCLYSLATTPFLLVMTSFICIRLACFLVIHSGALAQLSPQNLFPICAAIFFRFIFLSYFDLDFIFQSSFAFNVDM